MTLRNLVKKALPRSVLHWVREGRAARADGTYGARLQNEHRTFADNVSVHDLPQIFHYWSNRYLAPKLQAIGFRTPDDLFHVHFSRAFASPGPRRFASIGAGNCDTEVRVARRLVDEGHTDFVIECVEINEAMLARGRELALSEGVAAQVRAVRCDFNEWRAEGRYDAVMANQSLHHVVRLEHLLDEIGLAIADRGTFVTSDMIGRNGHQRWPEALAIVREFWTELPASYRYNRQLRRREDEFMDWDCSQEGFEGIRAQDVLPLLAERFRFELFAPFANVIDPFIDRGFGHNFDAGAEWDRGFIDRVHARDEAEIRRGSIKPTHLMAALVAREPARQVFLDGLQPAACIRRA